MVEEERNSVGQEVKDASSETEVVEDQHSDDSDTQGEARDSQNAPTTTSDKQPATWGNPLHRFSNAWTRVEVQLCVAILIAEILALCAWVLLKGLAVSAGADSSAGIIVRAAVGAIVLGLATYFVVRKKNPSLVRFATSAAILSGLILAKAWEGVGSVYFSNLLNWLQDGSTLTLIGGLRGLGTRLTIWLAMLGGSLAAASGKHIHIDVVRRFLPERLRMPTTMVAWTAAACVCFITAWGFTDHVAIASYHVDRNAPASEKISTIGKKANFGFFVLRKQIALDASTLPVVLAGKPYDSWLTNEMWNERVKDAGWEKHFTPEQMAALQMPPESGADLRMPVVVIPGASHSGMLVHLLNMVFPFGFLLIGFRFLLRSVMVISGHVKDEHEVEAIVEQVRAAKEKGAEG